jgi:hypothetical protein
MSDEVQIATVQFDEETPATDYVLLLDDTIEDKPWLSTEQIGDGKYAVYKQK